MFIELKCVLNGLCSINPMVVDVLKQGIFCYLVAVAE